MTHRFTLTLACADRPGIVHAVSGFLVAQGCNIIDSAQHGTADNGRFFMRVHFEGASKLLSAASLRSGFAPVGTQFAMNWAIHDVDLKPRVAILVSKFGHCLNDLLYRHAIGALGVEIPMIISNHTDFAALAANQGVPFHHVPAMPGSKDRHEGVIEELIERERVDFIVLARYMQVLSDRFCERMPGRIINIHHSFLPSFKGARPYQQAHARGVKLIGATAHYVTAALDEGPIIEQDVARVDHTMTSDDLVAVGRDVECVVLARAVKWHSEHRVLLNDTKTVVFR